MQNLFNFVHRWNSLLCPPIGLFFNFLLIFLVQIKTPKEMRIQSLILLQTAILDILLLLLTIFGQPVLSYQESTMILYFEGYLIGFYENNDNSLIVFFTIFYTFSMLDTFGVAIQFLYRYFMFNRNFKLTLNQYLCLIFSFFIAIFIFNIYGLLMALLGTKLEKNAEKLLLDGAEPTKFYVHLITENTMNIIFDVIFSAFCFGCYGIIAFCGWNVAKFVNANLIGSKKELSRQMNRNLAIMAFLPMMFTTISMATICISFMTTNQELMSTIEMSIFLLIHLIPVLNPLVSIATNAPYRRAMFKMATKIRPTI